MTNYFAQNCRFLTVLLAVVAIGTLSPLLLWAGDPAAQGDGDPAQAKTADQMTPYAEKIPGTEHAIEMLPIPGGKFLMGSPEDEEGREDDEGPQIEVEIEPFWMGKYEITWDQYDPFVRMYDILKNMENRPEIPQDKQADAVSFPTPLWAQEAIPIIDAMGREGGYPAASMTLFAAQQYCKWLSKQTGHFYRLPTEAEWEYACRAGTTTAFYFGDDMDDLEDHGWYFDNSETDEGDGAWRKVGQKKPNPWGLYDMHGNVAEWVFGQYVPDHYKQFEGKTVSWKEALAWPRELFPLVARGGGWDSDAERLRSAARNASNSNWNLRDPQLPQSVWWHTESFWVGFRIVRPLNVPSEEEQQKYWEAFSERIPEILSQQSDRQVRGLVEKKNVDQSDDRKSN